MKAILRLAIIGVAFSSTLSFTTMGQEVYVPDQQFAGGQFVGDPTVGGPGHPPGHGSAGAPFITQIVPTFPGRMWFSYTGVNHGLGFDTGGYFTLGAKTRLGEDILNGRWMAEWRGHLAHEQGNVFTNVGIERVMSIKPANTDVGISFWYDADGDQAEVFGHTFQQVGVSGFVRNPKYEVRANGYVPVGRNTGWRVGHSDGSCFYHNYVLIQHGIDTALEGFDIEVSLAPWSFHMLKGKVDLGAYYYNDPDDETTLVESFGGVRARVNLQTMKGAMVQLEFNHDDRFDTTGFLRLVLHSDAFGQYDPMGRDLNPTIRNDHVVKYHQDPLYLIDPRTGLPYHFVHVDNSNTDWPGGDGTFENPYTVLQLADGSIYPGNSNPNDVIFVREGNQQYNDNINLLDGQYLLGDGVRHNLQTIIPGLGFTTYHLCNDEDGNIPVVNGMIMLGGNNVVRGFTVIPPVGQAAITARNLSNNRSGNPLLQQGIGGTLIDQVQVNGGAIGVDFSGSNAGNFVFTDTDRENGGDMSINSTTDFGIRVDGTNASSTLAIDYFGNLEVRQGVGISVMDTPTGSRVTFDQGQILIAGGTVAPVTTPTVGFQAMNVAGSVSFNKALEQTAGQVGVNIQNSPTGTFFFEQVDITNANGTGFNATDAGTLTVRGGNINTTNGTGLFVSQTLFDGTFSNISSSAALGSGISIFNLANGSNFQVTGGTITGSVGNPINIQNGAFSANFKITDMNITTVAGFAGNAIDIQSGAGMVIVADNTMNMAGSVFPAAGINLVGNAPFMNLGSDESFNNHVLNPGAGVLPLQTFGGANIIGNIQVNNVVTFP